MTEKKIDEKTLKISAATARELSTIVNKTGIPKQKLADKFIMHMIKQVKEGGKITIDVESGDLQFSPPLPKPLQVQNKPVTEKPKRQYMTQNPGEAREVNLG